MNTHHPLILVGAGPLGLELAVALKHAGIPCLHLEAKQIGATIQWWPPNTRWFSSTERIAIAGVPLVTPSQEKATREEYLAYLRAIVEQFQLTIHTFRRVTSLTKIKNTFHLQVTNSLHPQLPPQHLTADRVILTIGGTETPNLLHIPGEDLPHVSHYLSDVHTYFQKRLLIVGGANSAVEAALRCHKAGAHVSFSYRRPEVDKAHIKYWLYPEFSALLHSGKIQHHLATQPTAISPTHTTLRHADGSESRVEADFVLLLTGYRADMSLLRSAGVTLTPPQDAPTYNPDTLETNIPGLYVAGTCVAGTQSRYKVFLENCHAHVPKILAHLQGSPLPHSPDKTFDAPET